MGRKALVVEKGEARRDAEAFSLCILNIDHFKNVHDI